MGHFDNPYLKWLRNKKAERICSALRGRAFDVELLNGVNDALEKIIQIIPPNSTVAVGGSVTLEEMGLVEVLRKGPYRFYDRYQNLPFQKIVDIYRESVTADYFITSVNAITEAGELVCSDSSGNRVASLSFAAKKVIVVAGSNKLVKDIDAAFERIKSIEPLNCLWNHHHTESSQTGFFVEEISDQRMMNVSCIVHYGGKFPGRIHVLVLKDEAGF